MISQDSSNEARARMPCGHVISRESMTGYLQELIKNRKYKIQCPGTVENEKQCPGIWKFALCKQIGVFSKSEKEYFENSFSAIFQSDSLEVKNCPNCNSTILKPPQLKSERVSCPVCKKFDFCWTCTKKWEGKEYCGNLNCGNEADRAKILSNCKTKPIGSVNNVPEFRACPKCATLINHTTACKHIKCTKCDTQFCFVCLKRMQDGKWQCGGAFEVCAVAPRQTEMDINKIKFENKK